MPIRERVSVVIPAYNAEAHLDACLAAALVALNGDGECIVVSDGSTDRTAEIASRHECLLIENGRRLGPAAARNEGARVAQGDIILFIDADCSAHPDVVARVLAAFHDDAGLDALFGAYDITPWPDDRVSQFRTLLHAHMHRTARADASSFWTGCGAIRRTVLERLGGFDEAWSFME